MVGFGTARALVTRRRRWLPVLAATAVVLGVASPASQAAQATQTVPASQAPPGLKLGPAVAGVRAAKFHFVKVPDQANRQFAPSQTAWPAAAAAAVTLAVPAAGAGTRGAAASAAGTPVWAQAVAGGSGYAGPRTLNVRVLSHTAAQAAGVAGTLFTVAPAGPGTGTVRVGFDYKAFAQAYGGNFGSRLSLAALPACALTTPSKPACRTQVPLASANDAAAGTVSAQLQVAAAQQVVLAATSSASSQGQGGGPAGTYAASSLKPSGTWSEGGSTGAFSYSYPITVPPAASPLVPQLGLSYNSLSVDGQTAATQAQGSWAGDGWSTGASFIEQSFASCADNPEGSASPSATQDECYDGPVLTMSLDGTSTTLVCNAAETSCQASSDTGQVFSHVTGSDNGTGTHDSDYWKVTERDGTVYEFGRNELPGWAAGSPVTNSVATVPVYSAHSGDPCYNSAGFASSVCTMAYRWNLDYVKDVHGNAMAYYYHAATNYYGEDNGAHNVSYVRDTYLDHIDYGFTDGNAYGTVPDKVVFATGDRCLSGTCDPLNSANAKNWPDVPFDLVCASGASCSPKGPSFFSTVRLTGITTQQYSVASSSYATVDSYALNQTLPATGDGTSPTLWLASITRTGSGTTAGGSSSPITLPPVSFTGIDLPNRVDTVTDGLPPLYRFRIATITTETGSVITANYGQPSPCTAPVTTSPAANTSSCYPVYWVPPGYAAPFLDWFNSYVLTSVTQTDPTGGAPALQTSYAYLGGAAWHYDDNELVKAKYRTYGQYRGYGDVQVRTGDKVNDKQTLAETTYYRGMSDDNNSTAVTLTDSAGGTHQDPNQLAGLALESTSYLGDGGPADHSTITSYWVSAAAATRTRSGLPDLTANWVEPAETYTRQAVTGSGPTTWRYTETDTSYDATVTDADFGLTSAAYMHTVPVNAAYDSCDMTSYAAPNATVNLVGLTAEAQTDSVACGGFTEGSPASVPAALNTLTAPARVSRPAQVMSDTRTFYDDPAFAMTFPQAAPPAKGNVTMTEKASGYSGGAFTYQVASRDAYDSYGRKVAAYDADGNKTVTAYAMNAAGLTTGTTVTNPLGQAVTTTADPERGLTLTSTDSNKVVTTEQYDALGRDTSVWLDSRAIGSPANFLFSYQVSDTGLTSVTTQKLNDEAGYQTSVQIDDALLRPRQTQEATPQGGRLVTDTFYDTRGWTAANFTGWWDPANTPSATLATQSDLAGQAPVEDYYTYDGLGRAVIDDSENGGKVVSATTTVYNGDRTTVIPPSGGVTETTVTDPLGRTTELDDYTSAPTVNVPGNAFTGTFSVTGGTFNPVSYGYDGHGNRSVVTAAGRPFTSVYNLLGLVTAKTDPDAGTSAMAYDGNGNPIQASDARGKSISFTYDALNRKTGEYDAPSAAQSPANQLAAWAYDNSNGAVSAMAYPVGHLTTETAYWNGAAYTIQQKGFNVFGEPLGETVTIPSAEGALAGSYAFQHAYTTLTGLPLKSAYPAGGGLPAETTLDGYSTELDLPTTVGGLVGYGEGVTYDAWGRVSQQTIGNSTGLADITSTYDPHTGRLTSQAVTRRNTAPAPLDTQAYTYDLAGNITSQTSTRLGATAAAETQCYAYDQLDRLSAAWTATDSCAAQPSQGNSAMVGDNLAAASAYWTTWGFDALGNRTTQTDHATASGGASTTTSYAYNGNGAAQPDTLTSTTATGGTTAVTSYGYDADGNMTSRRAAQGNQTLTWDDAGRLTAITGGSSGDAGFVYDAGGNLLLEKDPGTTTLYLPGEQLTLSTATQAISGIRYYPLPGGGTAYRVGTGNSYGFEISDRQGTSLLSLDYTAQQPAWRQQTPYGAPRGQAVTWVDNHAFLGKPADLATGLDIVGARNYDSATGRFISVDPLLESTSSQELGGYTYAGSNPITKADPTGLHLCGDTCGGPSLSGSPGWVCGCGGGHPIPHSTWYPHGGGGGGGGGNRGGGWGGPGHRYEPTPCSITCNYLPNPGQLQYMRHLGYTGSKYATFPEIFHWLTNEVPITQRENGWDFFCQGLASQPTSVCKRDPITQNQNIYDKGLGSRTVAAVAVVIVGTGATAACVGTGVCEIAGLTAGTSALVAWTVGGAATSVAGYATEGGPHTGLGYAGAAVTGGGLGEMGGVVDLVVSKAVAGVASRLIGGAAGRMAVLGWLYANAGYTGGEYGDKMGEAAWGTAQDTNAQYWTWFWEAVRKG